MQNHHIHRHTVGSLGWPALVWIAALALTLVAFQTMAQEPPAYTPTVLPQLDTGDEFSLASTEGRSLNAQGEVTGILVNSGLGFRWSADSGGELLQPIMDDVAEQVRAEAMNADGQVVGGYLPLGGFLGQSEAFQLSPDGDSITLPSLVPDFPASALDINDSGMIVGAAQRKEDGAKSSVYWIDGEIHEIPDLGGPANNAFAVNNDGVVVGTTNEEWGSPWIPYRWSQDEGLQPLEGLLPDVPAEAIDINDHGTVVGRGGVSFQQNRPVYWDADGELHELPCLYDTPQCIAVSISNTHVMVGNEMNEEEPFPRTEARLWMDDQVYHLQDLVPDLPDNLFLTEAVDVNSLGQIIAIAEVTDADTPERVTVLLTPEGAGEIPEAVAVPVFSRYGLFGLAMLVLLVGVCASAGRGVI